MEWSWSPAISLKDSNTGVFLWIFQSFGGSFFYRTTLVARFEFYFSIRKEFLKKEVSGEIAFTLISLFHYKYKKMQAGQLPQEHLYFMQGLLNFIITKYIKQEVDDNLTVCKDEHSPCGLSVTGDIKICSCHVIKM